MSQDITSNPADSGDAVFPAAEYFLGIARRNIAFNENTRVVLPGKGEVSLFPGRKEYSAEISDTAEFFKAPAAQFEVSKLAATATPAPGAGKNIGELLWQAAFHASQGRLIDDISKYDIVQFRFWPNLTRLPKTQNTARICALLTRHPTTIMLVHRVLGIGKEEVYSIYSAAYSAGIASIRNLESTSNLRSNDAETAEADLMHDKAEPAQKQGLFQSLFSKISRL